MVLQQKDKLSPKDWNLLEFLYQKDPQIKGSIELAGDFKNLFLDNAEGALQNWLGWGAGP